MKRFGWTILLGLAVLAGVVITQFSPALVQAQRSGDTQMVATTNATKIIHLKHGVNEPRAAFMALNLANRLRDRGADVTLLLTMAGTEIANAKTSLDVRQANEPQTLAQLYNSFLVQGGKVKVCPDCAEAAGITNALREGTQLASGDSDVSSLLMNSEQVIDF
jgi:predicted peroxiredoxin